MVIKFGGLTPNNSIGGFKIGGTVWYCHTYMHTVENLADFKLVVERHTA